MTDEKLYKTLDLYEHHLENYKYSEKLYHLYNMIPKMRVFIEEGRREKVMRWLGFMQGSFWVLGIFNLDDLKEHNTPN